MNIMARVCWKLKSNLNDSAQAGGSLVVGHQRVQHAALAST